MRRWFQHHVVEAMPGHVAGWVVGGAIVALSGVSPDDWVAHLVHSTSALLPSDWSAATSALIARSSFATIGVAILAGTLLRGRRAKEPLTSGATTTPLPQVQPAPVPALTLPDKPSIAVLPFQNLSGDAEQDYFCDGMVEDITTGLSRMKWLFVIARNSSFTYKGKSVDVKQVGRELGVRYVLEGSVRKSGDRLRLSGQLVDATTGAHIWADRYEGDLRDVFDLQDKITESVVGAIAPALISTEQRRAEAKPTDSLDAYDYYLRALAQWYQLFWLQPARDIFAGTIALCQKAIARDPRYASAHGLAALCRAISIPNPGTAHSGEEARAEGLAFARNAIELGANDPVALWMAGWALVHLARDFDSALAAIDRSLSLDANSAQAWNASGWVRWNCGDGATAIEHLERASRLSPLDPQAPIFSIGIAWANFIEGHYDEAAKRADLAVRARTRNITAMRCKVAALGLSGRVDEAREAVSELLAAQPDATVSKLKSLMPMRRPEDLARYLDGLRKAGMPE